MRNKPISLPPFFLLFGGVALVTALVIELSGWSSVQEWYWAQTLRTQVEGQYGLHVTNGKAQLYPGHEPETVTVISQVTPHSLADALGFKDGDIPVSRTISGSMSEGLFYWILSNAKEWPRAQLSVVNISVLEPGWRNHVREINLKRPETNGT